MATNCCTAARRLSDLLREQQEPFLLLHLLLQDHDDDDDDDNATPPPRTPAAARRRRSLLRGSTVTKLALRWADDLLAGCCFPRAAATRQRFRRLPPRPDDRDVVASAVDCGTRQQLSPVSVLDLHLHSDDDSSPVPSRLDNDTVEDELGDDDDGNGKPSTSGGSGTGTGTSQPSPPSIHDHDNDLPGKTPAMVEVERFQRKSSIASASWDDDDWETVAADYLSRILSMSLVVELDLSGSPTDDWRRLVVGGGEEEARHVAQSIEAMIFEEVRWEAVRDMLCSSPHVNTDSSYVCY